MLYVSITLALAFFFFFPNFATAALRSMHINHVPCNQLLYRGSVFN